MAIDLDKRAGANQTAKTVIGLGMEHLNRDASGDSIKERLIKHGFSGDDAACAADFSACLVALHRLIFPEADVRSENLNLSYGAERTDSGQIAGLMIGKDGYGIFTAGLVKAVENRMEAMGNIYRFSREAALVVIAARCVRAFMGQKKAVSVFDLEKAAGMLDPKSSKYVKNEDIRKIIWHLKVCFLDLGKKPKETGRLDDLAEQFDGMVIENLVGIKMLSPVSINDLAGFIKTQPPEGKQLKQ